MNNISFVVMVSKRTDFWHSKITQIKAFDQGSISAAITILRGKDTDAPVRIFPVSSTQIGLVDTLDFMWNEGLTQQELQEYLDA